MSNVNYNTDSAKGKYIEDKREFFVNGGVGDWSFDVNQNICVAILIKCPDDTPDGCIARLPIGGDGWQWDGSTTTPNLTPSIDRHPVAGFKPGWHGYLTNGELKSV